MAEFSLKAHWCCCFPINESKWRPGAVRIIVIIIYIFFP